MRIRCLVYGLAMPLSASLTAPFAAAELATSPVAFVTELAHKAPVFMSSRTLSSIERQQRREKLLEEYFDIDVNPFRGGAWWEYYLFNLERVGVLLDQRYLGTHDWYQEGAEKLLAGQAGNGSFGGGVVNTAFALLFLKRATVPPLTQTRK